MRRRLLRVCSATTVLLVFAGCASAPQRPQQSVSTPVAGERIASLAQALIGSPYRFGGADPTGFDCSGLVFFVHHELGVNVPRTAADQSLAATPVDASGLEPGDVVFFRDPGPHATHVGVYVGAHRFVHAPKTGRPVSYASLQDDYYRATFLGAGRFYTEP
jgi:cell wall-associated NlpC family hydrolase